MKQVIDFFAELEVNNNRDWFNLNKTWYNEVKEIFLGEIQLVIDQLQLTDPSLMNLQSKDTIYRIYRDVRFSKDKLPYKTHIAAYMAAGGKKSQNAGYYIHISGSEFFLGAGTHSPQKEALSAIRSEILYQPEKYISIVKNLQKKDFRLYEEDKLKNGPKDFPKDSPHIEYLKYKHYLLTHDLSKKDVLDGRMAKSAVSLLKQVTPFVEFLNQAMEFQGNE